MDDWLKKSWEEGRQGADTVKTAALVNRTFTIHKVEPVEFRDQQGEQTWDYVGTITLDGEQETVRAWLGGVGVKEQLADMERNRRLPQRVTMSKNGQAYELTWPDPVTPAGVARAAASKDGTSASESPAGHSGQRGFGQYLREQGMTGDAALQALDITVGPGAKAPELFKTLLQHTMDEKGCSQDGAYDILLGGSGPLLRGRHRSLMRGSRGRRSHSQRRSRSSESAKRERGEMIGILVKCLNCKILWRRIAADDNPGGTVAYTDIQLVCPGCASNAYEPLPSTTRFLRARRGA